MTPITTIVKHRVRITGSEHQGQNSMSDPGQNLGFTCIFSSGAQEYLFYKEIESTWLPSLADTSAMLFRLA